MAFSPTLRSCFAVGLVLSVLLSASVLVEDAKAAPSVGTEAISELRAKMPHQASTPVVVQPTLTEGVRKTVLKNGLTVLTKEVHTAPVVSVQVWHRVGTRNEGPGSNGLSHQLEHLLFKGTKERPIQFGRLFSALGSQSNAFTSYDETAYFGTVERNKLASLLILEADRMQNALNGPEQLKSEKQVVISELQGYENSPGYRLTQAVMSAAFPNRAYGLPVGGTKADVEKFTVEQVQRYYKTYYRPDNATLIITGDFDTAAILPQIQQTFGVIPNPAQPLAQSSTVPSLPVTPSAKAPSKQPIVLKQPGTAALLEAIYPLPNINHPDVPAIDLMDTILTGGRSSRLYQALVEPGIASSLRAYPLELIEPGWYSISATAAAGQSLMRLDLQLQRELTVIRERPVSPEELNRAKAQLRAMLILGNQDITSQATQLGYNQTVSGDYRYTDHYLAAIEAVTPADIQRVARTYLQPDRQTIGFFEPTVLNGQAVPSSAEGGRTSEDFSPGEPVDPAEVAKYLPPVKASTTSSTEVLPEEFKLANGLRILLLSDRSAPTVNLSGQIQAGTVFDIPNKAGLANIAASNLMNGTQTQTALTLAKNLEDRGASLGFSASREGVNISGSALSEDLPILVQTLADTLQHPVFPEQQLELSRQRALINLKAALDDPQQLSRRVFQQAIYPENHPFHTFSTEDSLKQITREDLALFHQKYYRPDTTVLALVGDFDPTQVRSLLNEAFGSWKASGPAPTLTFPTVSFPKTTTYVSKTIPGKAEAVTYLGYSGISRKDPRYYAALVLNQVLGGDTLASRLGTEIRDRQGLTYGIYSAFASGIYPGPFLISMQTAPENVPKAIASTQALLKQIQTKGITPDEIEAAKRAIASSYPVDLASPSSLVETMVSDAVTGVGLGELRQFPSKIEAVTPEQVQQAIQDLIRPESLVIITAGPAKASS